MSTTVPAKLYKETHDTLQKIQEILPGKPTIISLLDEAVKLLAQKYLVEEGKRLANP